MRCPLCSSGSPSGGPQDARRPARGPVSPVAPRRSMVAVMCRRRIRASRLMCCVSQESPMTLPIRPPREMFKRLVGCRATGALPTLATSAPSVRRGEPPSGARPIWWQGGYAVGGVAMTRSGSTSPVPCQRTARIWVAERLQAGSSAEGLEGDFAANHWWAHVDSNHGPLPYQAGISACQERPKSAHRNTGGHQEPLDLQRKSWTRFPTCPVESQGTVRSWVAEWLQPVASPEKQWEEPSEAGPRTTPTAASPEPASRDAESAR